MHQFIIMLVLLLTSTAYAANSEEERQNKKFEISFQGGVDYRMSTSQVSAMYFLNSNDLLGVKFGNHSGSEKQTSIGTQYKHYFYNSFYTAADVFYLNTREDVNGFIGDVFEVHDYANYSSLGTGIRIGNQWTWKNFTLGCDWIGIGQRIGTFRKDTSKLNDTTLTLLNIIIGASF